MKIDPATLSGREAYGLLISTIVPRPIAWISSVASDGTPNLAPFSFFMGVASAPPTLAVAIGSRRGAPKDTTRNLQETREFVVNVVTQRLAAAMVETAGDYPPETDEFAACGLTPLPAEVVRAPRVAESPVAMECRLVQMLEIGTAPTMLAIGEILRFHIDEAVWSGHDVDPLALEPLGRLGGNLYAPVTAVQEIPRPRIAPGSGPDRA